MQEQEIISYLKTWRKNNRVTAVILSIQDQGKEIIDIADGFTDSTGKTPISSDKLFGVGSITKTFVSAALLQLQEEKKLSLDSPLDQYVGEYPRWGKITIRQLLNMTSGIANYTELRAYSDLIDQDARDIFSPHKMLSAAYAEADYFTPGENWRYSNTNYLLLGLILKKVTGQTFNETLEERFIKPLKLANTFYSDSYYSEPILNKMTHGYYRNQDVTNFNASLPGTAGSMVMNSHDILTWATALLTPNVVLSEISLKELKTTVLMPEDPVIIPGTRFGLGIYSFETAAYGTVWYYTGVINGYTSSFLYIPSRGRMIAVQASSWPDPHEEILFPRQEVIQKILNLK